MSSRPQPYTNLSLLTFSDDDESSVHVQSRRFDRSEHLEDERHRDVPWAQVHDSNERLSVANGEGAEVRVVRQNDTPFGICGAQNLLIVETDSTLSDATDVFAL